MTTQETLDPTTFSFWNAPEGMTLTTGEESEFAVPQIPLPIQNENYSASAEPSEKAIGDGIYAYLCRFPYCLHAADYARILQQAYPFLISDIGSELILLDVKAVAPEALRKKIALLTILNLLDEDNFGLLHKIGVANFDLGMHYEELSRIGFQLKEARKWLEKARRSDGTNVANLNLLAQVCYLMGSYHQARLYWRVATDQLGGQSGQEQTIEELHTRMTRIDAENLPEQPLVDSLEQIAVALEHLRLEEYPQARQILDHLELVGDLPRELPNVEFYYSLGLAREKCDDPSGAYEAWQTGLKLDGKHELTLSALNGIAVHGTLH